MVLHASHNIMAHIARFFTCAFISISLVSCTTVDGMALLKNKGQFKENERAERKEASINKNRSYLPDRPKSGEVSSRSKSRFFPGTDRFTRPPKPQIQQTAQISGDGVTLNLIRVSIRQAAKAVLGDILKVNYIIDDRVKGEVTIQTSSPISPNALLNVFEAILSSKGLAIVETQGQYKITTFSSARSQSIPIKASLNRAKTPGIKSQIIPLKYIAASEMERVLSTIAPKGAILRVDTKRNLLILLGNEGELSTIRDAISIFDIDIMKGKSFALMPLVNADPETAVKELQAIFESEAGGTLEGVVQFIANKRLNAVLMISKRADYLRRAEKWLRRLDRATNEQERRLFVYPIQNRPAVELANILTKIFQGATISSNAKTDNSVIAPRLTNGQIVNRSPANNASSANFNQESLAGEAKKGIRVVVDDANNALLIMATSAEYKRITRVLRRIDSFPNQVLLEAVIAEVSLNDELKFGLRWYFNKKNHNFQLSDAVNGAVSSVFPGFSYFFSTPNIGVALNALASITNVNVVSSPSLMVLDNKKAVLQVGDQVPIATQSSVSTTAPNAPVVNSVEFRDTGVILSITPRVSDSGRVVLEIEQEVSNVVQTTSSGIDSPTIQQRKIKTTVAVNDGESLTLGGLIQERNNLNRGQVPLVADVPLVGNLFKNKTNTIDRTELIIVIRPRVVRSMQEARSVTDEFRKRLNLDLRAKRTGPPDLKENVERVFGR